jgi:hypothetical protein
VRPFCVPDPNGAGDPPEYVITTLQLDAPNLGLHYAKEKEALNRFKLRCRTYGTDGTAPVFLEIKRKCKGIILKSRCRIPAARWGRKCALGLEPDIPFVSRHERVNYMEFIRLVHETCARPVIFIRYHRESYISSVDQYARVTFDRRMCYCEASGWAFPPPNTRWKPMDSPVALNRPFSGFILELKTQRDAPQWMVELTERFNLVRIGFCKYSTGVKMNALFQGARYVEGMTDCRIGI